MSAISVITSPPVLQGLQLFAEMIRCEMAQERERELTIRDNRLRELEAQERSERLAAQKDILTLMVQTARHVFDRKMDFLESSFARLMEMIGGHQQQLLTREAVLEKELIGAKSREQRLAILSELTKLRETLLELEHRAGQAQRDMAALVQSLGLSFDGQLPLAAALRG